MDTQRPDKRIYLNYCIRHRSQPLLENYLIRRILVHWRVWRNLDYRKKLPYLFGKMVNAFRSSSDPTQAMESKWGQAHAVVEVNIDKKVIEHIDRIRVRYRRVLRWHNPKPYEGQVDIL